MPSLVLQLPRHFEILERVFLERVFQTIFNQLPLSRFAIYLIRTTTKGTPRVPQVPGFVLLTIRGLFKFPDRVDPSPLVWISPASLARYQCHKTFWACTFTLRLSKRACFNVDKHFNCFSNEDCSEDTGRQTCSCFRDSLNL
jgi:hypothetical protein